MPGNLSYLADYEKEYLKLCFSFAYDYTISA